MVGVQCASAELIDCIHIDHVSQILVIPDSNLLDLVRSTESVEEVDERNSAFDCCKVSNRSQIHDFLYAGLAEHCETGLTACHNVGLIAEDGQSVACQGTSGNVEHAGEQLACDFVHVRDHQQKSLRCSVSGSQCTSVQRTVNCTGCTGFRLHFLNLYFRTENVLSSLCRPLINVVCHRAGRGNRVNCRDFRKCVRHMGSSSVAVHGFELSFHCVISHKKFLLYNCAQNMHTFVTLF